MVTAIGCIKVGLDHHHWGIELIRLGAVPSKGGSEMFPFTGIFVNTSKKRALNREKSLKTTHPRKTRVLDPEGIYGQ
jgi:hypothetical protein